MLSILSQKSKVQSISNIKILHTGDKASPDQCGQQHQYQKNPASKTKFAKKLTFFAQRFYTLYEQKFFLIHYFFPKDSVNLKSLDIGLQEVGATRLSNIFIPRDEKNNSFLLAWAIHLKPRNLSFHNCWQCQQQGRCLTSLNGNISFY